LLGRSSVFGVSHPVKPLSDVRRADAVCAQYTMPDGVAFSLQVCTYSVEPAVADRAFNLFTKDAVRAALADEAEERGPEVPVVALGFPLPRRRERLTGAASGPHGAVAPPGEGEGVVPASNARKEVNPVKSSNVICRHVADVAPIDFPRGNQAVADELAQPLGGLRVELVVIRPHDSPPVSTT
jgi:hypothetical protein